MIKLSQGSIETKYEVLIDEVVLKTVVINKLSKQIEELVETLKQLHEIVDDSVDIEDGMNGGQVPNMSMRIQQLIKQAIAKVDAYENNA